MQRVHRSIAHSRFRAVTDRAIGRCPCLVQPTIEGSIALPGGGPPAKGPMRVRRSCHARYRQRPHREALHIASPAPLHRWHGRWPTDLPTVLLPTATARAADPASTEGDLSHPAFLKHDRDGQRRAPLPCPSLSIEENVRGLFVPSPAISPSRPADLRLPLDMPSRLARRD